LILSSAFWEKKKKKREEMRGEERKEERNDQGLISQDWRLDMPCWLCQTGFQQLLGATKG
jgi:hypothetical protein